MYRELRKHLGEVFHKLAAEKEAKIVEGHLMPDHVHMMISIPPKYAVSQVVGFIKGKSAIHLARVYGGRKRNFVGQHFWARGFFVNTVGAGRGGNPRLRPQPREGGSEIGPTQSLALTATFRWLNLQGPRQRPLSAASGGPNHKSPRLCRGMLTVNSAILAIFSSCAHGSAMCSGATSAIAPRFSSGRTKPE